MSTINYLPMGIQKIRTTDVVISEVTNMLYDYSNRGKEIKALMESISEIGQKEPIIVLRNGEKFTMVDGVLRLMAMDRLKLNEIDAIVSTFKPTPLFSFTDYVVHHQIRKEKTENEKLNEIKTLLRIDNEDPNPLKDKEKRVALVTNLMGVNGWGRNNVFNLEKILRWEKVNGTGLSLSERVIKNEVRPARAIDAINLIETEEITESIEKESDIVKQFLNGSFEKEKAKALVTEYKMKKNVPASIIELYPPNSENFQIIQGNIEEIDLPENIKADTIFTSPPYYKLIKYGSDPNELGWEKTPDLYVKRLSDILMKCFEKLKDSGSMFVNIGESYENGQCYGVIDRLTCELMSRGVRLVDKIIWRKPAAKPLNNSVKRLHPSYELILHFSKTKDFYYDPFKVRKDKKMKVSKGCKEKGVEKTTYHIPNQNGGLQNFLDPEELTNIITLQINVNRTKHVKGEEYHPATFSMDLPLIPLAISCPKSENTVVFDPFMGSGSCGVTALKMGFKFIGVELYEKNIVTARRMLRECQKEYDEVRNNEKTEELNITDVEFKEAA